MAIGSKEKCLKPMLTWGSNCHNNSSCLIVCCRHGGTVDSEESHLDCEQRYMRALEKQRYGSRQSDGKFYRMSHRLPPTPRNSRERVISNSNNHNNGADNSKYHASTSLTPENPESFRHGYSRSKPKNRRKDEPNSSQGTSSLESLEKAMQAKEFHCNKDYPADSSEAGTVLDLSNKNNKLEESLPGLGTWAGRQRIFGLSQIKDVSNRNEDLDDTLMNSSSEIEGETGAVCDMPTKSSLDYMHEAWRWRFARKWQSEQLKQQEPLTSTLSTDFDDDEWSSALEYMNAASGGLNLQFGRTTSLERTGSAGPATSMSSMMLESSLSKGDLFLASETPGGTETVDSNDVSSTASRHVARTALKARELMACQEKIEKEVALRWESASAQDPAWVAQRIPAVTIDSYGSFKFILGRVIENSTGRQKLLLRGRNGSSENQITNALQREIDLEATKLRRSNPEVQILGSGVMTWRDRTLLISTTDVKGRFKSSPVATKEDVARVAGALARTGVKSIRSVAIHI